MAITVNWATKVINVPQADLVLISGSLYEFDVDEFRLSLKEIEDSEIGMGQPDTHQHSTQVVLSGVTYARTFEIINGYTVTFEDGQYSVRCVGANHNIADVKNVNQVSLIVGNSAGLIVGGGGSSPADIATAVWGHASGLDVTAKLLLIAKILRNKQVTDPVTGKFIVYDDNGVDVLYQGNLYEDVAGLQTYRGRGAERRERIV